MSNKPVYYSPLCTTDAKSRMLDVTEMLNIKDNEHG
jgi:hypothetical protein